MKQIHQNEWTQPPECNPGAEAQDVEKAIAFRLSVDELLKEREK